MEKFLSDKIEGKLRAIGRSSPSVNTIRSECNGAIKVATTRSGKSVVEAPQTRAGFRKEFSIKNET